jgi:hypothetical protein
MLRQIIGYILAWLSMSLLSSLLSLIFFPLMFIGRRIKALAAVMTFFSSAVSMFVALLIFVWICGKTEIQPTYLMFFLPYLAVVSNNFRRIDRAKKSKPTVEEIAGEDYEPSLQLRMEYGYLIGDISGWLLFLLSLSRLPLY